ncbi:hypothetical protein T12_297 [Trichinella patagoniensis]|uniref:Uncharacterized protein n=1 Tax=Trichinella patagoniensis TaxID=990121 RepID=A0A0V1A1K4_9BILA|nr:hypothetical protein T12_297 [Trichinella patagoniensis]
MRRALIICMRHWENWPDVNVALLCISSTPEHNLDGRDIGLRGTLCELAIASKIVKSKFDKQASPKPK